MSGLRIAALKLDDGFAADALSFPPAEPIVFVLL